MASGLSLITGLMSLGLMLDGTQPPVQRPTSAPLKIAQDTQSPQGFVEPQPTAEAEPGPAAEVEPQPTAEAEPGPAAEVEPQPAAPTPVPAALAEPASESPLPDASPVEGSPPARVAESEGALPNYDSVPTPGLTAVGSSSPEAPRDTQHFALDVPRDGRGMTAVGAIGLAGSTVLLVSSGALAVSEPNSDLIPSSIVIGSLGMLVSTLITIGGTLRHKRYRRWERRRGETVPTQGFGLAGSGGVLLTGGAVVGVTGTMMTLLDMRTTGQALIGLAVGSLAVGAGLTIAGVKRNKSFKRWRSQADHRPLSLNPSVAPMRGGAQLGLSGRF